MSKVIAPPILT